MSSCSLPRRHALLVPLVCCVLLVCGCGVPRVAPPPGLLADESTLPNLKRGQQSLRDRIALEKEHVEALNQQLSRLRSDEERLYTTYLAAEDDYQIRAQDLAGVENDIAGVRQQLEDARTQLEVLRQEQGQLQADLALAEADVVKLRQALGAAHALREALAQQAAAEGIDARAALDAAAAVPTPAPASADAPPAPADGASDATPDAGSKGEPIAPASGGGGGSA